MKKKELIGLCLVCGTCLVFSACGGTSEEEQTKRDEAAKYEHIVPDEDEEQGGNGTEDENNPSQGNDGTGDGNNPNQGGDGTGDGNNPSQGNDGAGDGNNPSQGGDGTGDGNNPSQGGDGTGDGNGSQNPDDKEEPVTFEPANDQISINANALRLRLEPSLDGEIYKMSYRGEIYRRTGIGSNGFDRLVADGITVYAAAQYLEFYDPTAVKYPEVEAVDLNDKLYSYADMQEDLDAIAEVFGDLITINELTVTADGRSVQEIVIGSENASKHILITAGINGRDYITSQLVLSQLESFLNSYYTGTCEGITYEGLTNKVAIHMVPMVNPDGVSISQEGLEGINSADLRNTIKSCYENVIESGFTALSFEDYLMKWKANANGVDLNRNFSIGFEDYFGIGVPGAEKYKGAEALSQAETKALAELTEKIKPAAVINYHTSGNIIYWNFEQAEDVQAESKALAEAAAEATGYEIDNWPSIDAATYSDWTAVAKGIPTIDIEVGTGSAPVSSDSFADIRNANKELWALVLYRYR